jgi:hypothetical protein
MPSYKANGVADDGCYFACMWRRAVGVTNYRRIIAGVLGGANIVFGDRCLRDASIRRGTCGVARKYSSPARLVIAITGLAGANPSGWGIFATCQSEMTDA